MSPTLKADSLPLTHQGSPFNEFWQVDASWQKRCRTFLLLPRVPFGASIPPFFLLWQSFVGSQSPEVLFCFIAHVFCLTRQFYTKYQMCISSCFMIVWNDMILLFLSFFSYLLILPNLSFKQTCGNCLITNSDPTLCSPTGSSVHGISQARILDWVSISFSRGFSRCRDWTHISYIGRRILYHWATMECGN